MKLAEALIERAELKRKNFQLTDRINSNIKVQEGEVPAESPEELIAEYEHNMERMLELIKKINETNAKTFIKNKDGENGETIKDAIAKRDCLSNKINAYRMFCDTATIRHDRFTKTEVKFIRCIDIKEIQNKINELSKEFRILDTKLQEINWTTDLIS